MVEWEGEEVIIAANGTDGVAVRYPDGTWERWGWLSDDSDPVPMPSSD